MYKFGISPYKGVQGARFIRCEMKSTGKKVYKYSVYYDPKNPNDKEEEMYELTEDPYEQNNLVKSENFNKLKRVYFKTLHKRHFAV